jgi:hypothetical protein
VAAGSGRGARGRGGRSVPAWNRAAVDAKIRAIRLSRRSISSISGGAIKPTRLPIAERRYSISQPNFPNGSDGQAGRQ